MPRWEREDTDKLIQKGLEMANQILDAMPDWQRKYADELIKKGVDYNEEIFSPRPLPREEK